MNCIPIHNYHLNYNCYNCYNIINNVINEPFLLNFI